MIVPVATPLVFPVRVICQKCGNVFNQNKPWFGFCPKCDEPLVLVQLDEVRK